MGQAPPDGFRYTDPDCKITTVAIDPVTWLSEAKQRRIDNHLQIPDDFFEQMQEQLCRTLPPELCTYSETDPEYVNTNITWADVIGASRTYLEWRKQGKPFVSQEEAERRASICAGCYLNVRVKGCGGLCQEIIRLATETNGSKQTTQDAKLLNCAVCRCYNASQVHFPNSLLELNDTPERQARYPAEFCWKRKGGVNYRPDSD